MSIHFISFSSFWNGNLVRNLIAGIDRLLYGILNFQISPMELTFEANYSICSSELASLTSNLIYHWIRVCVLDGHEESCRRDSVLGRGSQRAYKSNCPKPGRKEEISGARLFSSPSPWKGEMVARHLFPKAGDFWSTNSLDCGPKVLLREQRQYLCQG